MQAQQDTYPIFEANQVLTNAHLNQVFNYLDEQQRLTRANLIGIGIVCGLEIRVETLAGTTAVHLSKGCGITSEGYLLLEPADVALVAYHDNYRVPPEPGYAPFRDPATNAQYPLWELFEGGEPNVQPLTNPAGFLDDKALLLFLELEKAGLRNCSAGSCDDKGAAVTATVRRLLVRATDLTRIVAAANQLGHHLTGADLETALLARLNLPDLRLPRYNVPNTRPTTSEQVLAGFHAVFTSTQLVQQTAAALTAAYQAFRPVVGPLYATNPFAGFAAKFGFLDSAPTSTAQVKFLPYYYDFFGDLLQAYDEFRGKGAALLCACCPAADLFPRHLMTGPLRPETVANPGVYRQRFLGSAAVSGCEALTQEVEQLFRRLVEMVNRFTAAPPLTPANAAEQIRLTPSKLADVPLSEKAIPYYYLQTGAPPLYQLWNPTRTRRHRAHHTLSYCAAEFQPAPPAFVLDPLRYDLEPYNFLRIEGHLGKSFQSALGTLLSLKARYRLPIDVVALRTGAFDEKMAVDMSQETARFQDLETLYDTLREEIMTTLAEGARNFYAVAMPKSTDPATTAQLPLLKKYAPGLAVQPGTVGAWFEKNRATLLALPYIDVDQTKVGDNTIWTVFCLLFQHAAAPAADFYPHVVAVYYFQKLAEMLPDMLNAVGFAALENKYEDLLALARYFRSEAAGFPPELAKYQPQEELVDQFDQVLYGARLAPLRVLRDEYKRRVREARQKQFLGSFLRRHPGIQHKAGVPLGGTFILVYHDDPDPQRTVAGSLAALGANFNASQLLTATVGGGLNLATAAGNLAANPVLTAGGVSAPVTAPAGVVSAVSGAGLGGVNPAVAAVGSVAGNAAVLAALGRLEANQQLAANPDVQLLLSTLGSAAGVAPTTDTAAGKIIRQAVDELTDGTIIADFYLPYQLGGEGGVQFVLPKPPPTFTVAVGCTNSDRAADITLTPEGGQPPYSYRVDEGAFEPLKGPFWLAEGEHFLSIQDAEATESVPQRVVVAGPLALGEEIGYECVGEQNEYVVTAQIFGGTAPYSASRGTIEESRYLSDALPGNQDVPVTITDSRQCSFTQTFNHSCLPPLAFTAQVGCTSPNQEASVEIRPTGGTAPYQVRVDASRRYSDLTGPLTLAVGTHTVVVRDAAGLVTEPQTVVVLPPLTLAASKFECDADGAYRATIQIRGGLPPYFQAGEKLPADELTTEPTKSGQPVRVAVTDRQNCAAELEVTHTCEPPCPLPCGGQSRRCAYRLWVQPAAKDREYKLYNAGDAKITLRYNGKAVELPAGLVALKAADLNGKFDNAVGAAIKKLNDAVAKEIGPGLVELSYRPDPQDPFARLWIEYFTCETFSLSFDYTLATPDPVQILNVTYTNEPQQRGQPFNGAVFVNRSRNNLTARLPAFDCTERNQCTGSVPKAVCQTRAIRVSADQSKLPQITGQVSGVPAADVAAWVWELADAQPNGAFQTGPSVSISSSGEGRLTVITKTGCFATEAFQYAYKP